MFNLDYKTFWNAAGVIDAMDRKIKRVLDLTGLDTRQAMKRGMKSGGKRHKKHSKPGEYPFYHQGASGGLRAIKFETDVANKTVAVGPIRFARNSSQVPELINFGGKVRQVITLTRGTAERARKKPKKVRKRDARVQSQKIGDQIIRNFTIEPRPFIALTEPAGIAALRKQMDKVPLT